MEQLPAWLTIEQVMERYHQKRQTLLYWHHIGKGPTPVKSGRNLLYSAEAIREYDQQLAAEARQRKQERSNTGSRQRAATARS